MHEHVAGVLPALMTACAMLRRICLSPTFLSNVSDVSFCHFLSTQDDRYICWTSVDLSPRYQLFLTWWFLWKCHTSAV